MSPEAERGPSQADAEKLSSAPPSTQPVLETVGLSRSFGPIEVLSDVSIRVRVGEVHAIIGENPPGPFPLHRRRSAGRHILTLVEAP